MKQVNEMTVVEMEKHEFRFKFFNGLLYLYNMDQSNYVQGNIMNYVSPNDDRAFSSRITAILFHALEMKGMSQDEVERQALRAYERHAKRFVDNQAMDQFIGIKLDKQYQEAKPMVQDMINIALDTKDESWFRRLTTFLTAGALTEERMAHDVQAQLDKYGVDATPQLVRWLAQYVKPAYSFSMEKGFSMDIYEMNRRLFNNPYGPNEEELPF